MTDKSKVTIGDSHLRLLTLSFSSVVADLKRAQRSRALLKSRLSMSKGHGTEFPMLFQKSLTSFLQNSKGFGGRSGLIGSQLFVIHSIFLPSYSYFIHIMFDIHFLMESGGAFIFIIL